MGKVAETYREERVAHIRDAAMRVFVRCGVDAATMQEIASEAGLSAGAIYRYFQGKEELTRSVFDYCRDQSRGLLEESPAGATSPLDALFAIGRVVWDEFTEPGARDAYALRLAASIAGDAHDGQLSAEIREVQADLLGRLTGLIRQVQAEGEIRHDIDPGALALTILSCVQGLQILFVQFEADLDAEPAYEALKQMLLALRPGR